MTFLQRRKRRKRLHAMVQHARGLRNMREDVMSAAELARLNAAMEAAEQARHGRDADAMQAADKELGDCIDALTPPCRFASWRENFEVLVVALGVAMAFRAYFYQPFQIPTGSMQPTLYGISSFAQEKPRPCDQPWLKAPCWLVTGEYFRRETLARPAKVAFLSQMARDDRVPGYSTVVCGQWPGALPPPEVFRREPFLRRMLLDGLDAVGIRLREYDYHFIPNDAVARREGMLSYSYLPPPGIRQEVAGALRQQAAALMAAAADGANAGEIQQALLGVRPFAYTLPALAPAGSVADGDLQALMLARSAVEMAPGGPSPTRPQAQEICRRAQTVLWHWSQAAAAGSERLPWLGLVTGCGVTLPAGELLWSGVVTSGDQVFVNRWIWNFRAPRRGEVMVFSTQDIPTLPPNTHYIKRMCGLPGETLSIHPPELWIDGHAVTEPHTIGRVARKERLAPWAPPYGGYRVTGHMSDERSPPPALPTAESVFHLAPDQYFAMGDNTGNSLDSRYWGAVPRRNLLGPAAAVYWPFASRRWGRIE
jgi:signal peptidase I